MPHGLMAGDEWQLGFHRPIALGRVKVSVTHPTGYYPHKDLSGARTRNRYVFNDQRLSKFMYNGSFHGLRQHFFSPY
jgi:hypothetical protein